MIFFVYFFSILFRTRSRDDAASSDFGGTGLLADCSADLSVFRSAVVIGRLPPVVGCAGSESVSENSESDW